MQGNLGEIDIRSILQLIELGQRTGELLVEAYTASKSPTAQGSQGTLNGQSWFVFCANGQIVYATQSAGSLVRLRDYLYRYQAESVLDMADFPHIASINAREYGYLWVLLEKKVITPAQGRSIIQSMIYETLFDLLDLRQGSFIFEMGPALSPQLTTMDISPLVARIAQQLQQWKQLHPHIQSTNQCPLITNPEQLRLALPSKIFDRLSRWADGKTTISQIARYLNRDVIAVAHAIYPFVQQGSVQLYLPPESNADENRKKAALKVTKIPKVVCIDDDRVVQTTVESILNNNGYEATAIGNPLMALSQVFQIKPDLILCDIAMPELDGYEVCAMLRNSTAFRQTPIIMLTGMDGFIDRLKARMVGANDYFTKPFGANELLMLVEPYIGPGVKGHEENGD